MSRTIFAPRSLLHLPTAVSATLACGMASVAAATSPRTIAKTWAARSVPDGVQSFKKNILLYPESGDLATFDPWLIGAEDWIQKPGGFEPHPHRGFETVTIVLEGGLRHTDASRGREGNTAVVYAGDVQWMTAGRGVVHSEMPEGDGVCHVLQIWLNLPKVHKMVPSGHQDLRGTTMPTWTRDGASVRVIAGEHGGVKGNASTHTPVSILDVTTSVGASAVDIAVPATHRGFMYVLQGSFEAAGTAVATGQVAWLSDGPDAARDGVLRLQGASHGESRVIVFFGEPIREAVASRGPFVMNTNAELRQAVIDYQGGLF